MKRIRSQGQIVPLLTVAAFVAIAFSGHIEVRGAMIAQLGGPAPGHALFIGSDGTLMVIDPAAASAERIALPVFKGFPETAQSFAIDPLSRTTLIAASTFPAESHLSLYTFDDFKKPKWVFPLNLLFPKQIAWTGKRGEFYVDAISRSVRPGPGSCLILQDVAGGVNARNAPKLSKAIANVSQPRLVLNGIPTGTAAFGAMFEPDFEKTAEFRGISTGQSPYYHRYLCLTHDGQIIKAWPGDSAQAVAMSFDGQLILASYQAPTKDPPLEMAKFDVKTGQIQKCDWLPPGTIHLFCASDDLNEVIIPLARVERRTSVEFTRVRDALFAEVPQPFNVCIGRVSAKRPPLMIHAWTGELDKAFDFAAMTTAPGEFWITDGISLWHLDDQSHLTEKKLKIK